MTENELRRIAERSRKDGFRALFQEYQSYVYKIVWGRIRSVGTVEDAEECVSDVFADVFFHFDEITEGSLKAYIGTAAKRDAIDCYRKLSAKRGIPVDEEQLERLPSEESIAENCENSEQNGILYEKIRSLGEPDATIIIQRYYYDRESGDIAKSVNMTATAVRVRLNRALKRLKKILSDEEFTWK